jgi:hypothetical protein
LIGLRVFFILTRSAQMGSRMYSLCGDGCNQRSCDRGRQWLQAERQRRSAEKNAERAQQNEARSRDLLREASEVDFVTATQQEDPAAKLAYLARAVRQDPSNQVACISLEQLITQEGSFPKAPVSSVRHEESLLSVASILTGNGSLPRAQITRRVYGRRRPEKRWASRCGMAAKSTARPLVLTGKE